MQFLKKRLIFLLALLIVYAAFFLTHLPQKQQKVLGTFSNLSLFSQPQDGEAPIINAINTSGKSVDVEVYLLSDADVISSLLAACGRGVVVRVMLEEHPFGGGNINQKTQQLLATSCVKLEWTSSAFTLTHEKAIIIDEKTAFILNQNLTTSAFTKNREYDIIDTNKEDVSQLESIFTADWKRQNITITTRNLVVSPVTSRTMLSALINSSQKTLNIETEVIDDPDMVSLIIQKAKTTGVHVILPSFSQVAANKKIAQELSANGVVVKTIKSPYIHAKLIIADSKAYIGSVNLTSQSLDENREAGIIIAQSDIIGTLLQDFESDWEKATPVSF